MICISFRQNGINDASAVESSLNLKADRFFHPLGR